MNDKKSLFFRLLGLAMVVGGLAYFYFGLPIDEFMPGYRAYLPEPWKAFAGLICAWIVYASFLNWEAVSKKLKISSTVLGSTLVVAVIAYLGTVFLINLIAGVSWGEMFSALIAISGPHFGFANVIGLISVGFILLLGCLGSFASLLGDAPAQDSGIHHRGRRLISFTEARTLATQLKAEDDPGLSWGMLNLPSEVATTHFLVTGATGSGKTITLRLLMQSVLTKIGKGQDCRALVYDAKQDITSILAGMDLQCPVVTLNPFDKRSAAWDMARDITGPATAQQVASILIPENRHESQPFFSDAARHLLTGVLITFIKSAPEKWTLRDVVLAMRNKDRLKQVLSTLPDTSDLLEYFTNDNTAQNILSTLQSRMQRYEFIAAAWDKASKKISLRDWIDGEFILILGNDEATRTALDAINQVIFKRLTELILALPESATRRNWIFLDEVREAGELDGLGRLLTKGRSKGACVVLGFQDIDGLRDVYGTEVANEIAGLCSNKAILRTDSPSTAEWASKLFGEREVLETRQSSSESKGKNSQPGRIVSGSNSGKSSSTQEQLNKREVVMASEFMDMLPTTPVNGLSGYYLTPAIGAYSARIGGDSIGRSLRPANDAVLNIEPRSESDQYLSSWSTGDRSRLGLDEEDQSPQPASVQESTTNETVPRRVEAPDLGFLAQIKRH
jgi:hypothetical protein